MLVFGTTKRNVLKQTLPCSVVVNFAITSPHLYVVPFSIIQLCVQVRLSEDRYPTPIALPFQRVVFSTEEANLLVYIFNNSFLL